MRSAILSLMVFATWLCSGALASQFHLIAPTSNVYGGEDRRFLVLRTGPQNEHMLIAKCRMKSDPRVPSPCHTMLKGHVSSICDEEGKDRGMRRGARIASVVPRVALTVATGGVLLPVELAALADVAMVGREAVKTYEKQNLLRQAVERERAQGIEPLFQSDCENIKTIYHLSNVWENQKAEKMSSELMKEAFGNLSLILNRLASDQPIGPHPLKGRIGTV